MSIRSVAAPMTAVAHQPRMMTAHGAVKLPITDRFEAMMMMTAINGTARGNAA
jgi:hypothetical protein